MVIVERRVAHVRVALRFIGCGLLSLALTAQHSQAGAGEGGGYAPEWVHDVHVGRDESLVNVKIRSNRWPDCHTLQTMIKDIFRIEGVAGPEGETPEKAAALWKWFRILICNSVPHAREGPLGKTVRQREPHKSMSVYGHHECGGLSAPMAALWRAAGFIGYKESSRGHSTVVLRYPDKDGIWRMHAYDPMGGFQWWDAAKNRVGVRSLPLMRGTVFRRLEPVSDHSLRTSLRRGERLERRWESGGCILRNESTKHGFFKQAIFDSVAGLEIQTLEADSTPAGFARALWEGSADTACSPPAKGGAALHPAAADRSAVFIYRLPSAYVAVEAVCEATLIKGNENDICRLFFSTDMAKTWHLLFDKRAVGREKVKLDLGVGPYLKKQPSASSNYCVLVKAEFRTARKPASVGMDRLKLTLKRQLNRRMLTNLLPGKNLLEVSAERMEPGTALELAISYTANGKPHTVTRTIGKLPFYFEVNIDGVSSEHLKKMRSKVTRFNIESWPLRMTSIAMRLVPAKSGKLDSSLPAKRCQVTFAKKYPHPFTPVRKRSNKRSPTLDSEVSGFLPQAPRPAVRKLSAKEKIEFEKLLAGLRRWDNAQALGAYPRAVEPLCKALKRANGDLTIFICKALAQIGDPRAVPALRAKWNRSLTNHSPGTRYIPDALAACGGRSAVPDLLRPLKKLRCDYRFHVLRAVGMLGGAEAKAALEHAAQHDPHRAVREMAKTYLKQ
jgi:PBS lyase HEAT-like repeat